MTLYRTDLEKRLSAKGAGFLAAASLAAFLIFLAIIFSLLIAERCYEGAIRSIGRARSLPVALSIEKVGLYREALRGLERAARYNRLNSKYYAAYASAISTMISSEDLMCFMDRIEVATVAPAPAGYYELAREKFLRAIDREPTDATYHLSLGWVYGMLSEFDEDNFRSALEEFKKATELDSTNIGNRVYLSRYFLSRDEKGRSFRELSWAVHLANNIPMSDPVVAVRELISELTSSGTSEVGSRENEIFYRLGNRVPGPYKLELPLGLRVYLKDTGQPIEAVLARVLILPGERELDIKVKYKKMVDGLLVFELTDLYTSAASHGQRYGWGISQIYLKGIEVIPFPHEAIEDIELFILSKI